MKKRSVLRAAAFLCALAVLAVSASFPTASAEQSETVFYVRSDVSSDYVSLGDVITFSVDVSDCPGIAAGSLCASASSSVDFVSATFCGEDVPADLASGPNAGARVIDILDPDTDKKGFFIKPPDFRKAGSRLFKSKALVLCQSQLQEDKC